MVVRASALLTPRTVAAAVLAGALVAYYASSESLSNLSNNWDIAFVAAILIPAVFALVYFALPLWRAHGLLLLGIALAALAIILQEAGFGIAANFAKLATMTVLAFWFLGYFESVTWVALVAFIVPWVDAYSVWRGPTSHIVKHQQHLFTTLSFAFPVPGEHASANLGLPDLLFFALFLGAAARFALRPGWTWIALTASFGVTTVLAVVLDTAGLPALPLLSLGFLIANADLLWRARPQRTARPAAADDRAAE